MTKPKITYLLGAGASYATLPIISDFAKHLDNVANLVNTRSIGGSIHGRHYSDIQGDFIRSLKWLSQESKKYNTIDTFARKLFLNGREEDLLRLKATLSIFFLILQFHDGSGTSNGQKKASIQNRYISLISAFLQKDESVISMPDNIRFITWNYDLQLELALQYFLIGPSSFESVLEKFRSFPNHLSEDEISKPAIVHLNGVAGLFPIENKNRQLIDIIRSSEMEAILHDVLSVFETTRSGSKGQIKSLDTFYFSWEKTSVSNSAIEHAKNIMRETNILVVIGYSFPVFNREVDRILINEGKNRQLNKIYYQDPKADKNAFESTFGLAGNTHVHVIHDTEQFFLPFEF